MTDRDMRGWITLVEAVRANMLYHATTVDNLYEMLDADEIKPNTGFPITHDGGAARAKHWMFRPEDVSPNGYLKGVSLTRSLIFARSWKSEGVVLVLDGDRIKHDTRIQPLSFWGQRRAIVDEAEEFVIGTIKPLSKYLIQINVSQRVMDQNSLLADLPTLFDFKPKLVVDGVAWRRTGLNKGTTT